MIIKIKNLLIKYKKEIIIVIFVFLITSLSFGLGYLVASKITAQTPIVFEKCS